jgi:hypothetical protein
VKIPAATSVFHNIIKMHGGDEEWLDNQEDNIDRQPLLIYPMVTVITTKTTIF